MLSKAVIAAAALGFVLWAAEGKRACDEPPVLTGRLKGRRLCRTL